MDLNKQVLLIKNLDTIFKHRQQGLNVALVLGATMNVSNLYFEILWKNIQMIVTLPELNKKKEINAEIFMRVCG